MNYRFSVIIPIYNAGKTLRRCIGSLLYQEYSDVQIILVNDGSTDNTGNICEKYSQEYNNIKYIKQENKGVSAARNKGIAESEGEWILFVDSDDYVSRNYFSIIDRYIDKFPCDLLVFANYYQRNNKLVKKEQKFFYSSDLLSTRKKIRDLICRKTINSPWGKAYRRDIIQNHRIDFTEGVSIAEDRAFNIKYTLYISSLCIVPERVYCTSLDNDNSLSRRVNRDDHSHFSKAAADIDREIQESGLSKSECRIFYQAINFCDYRSIYRIAKELNRDGIKRKERISRLQQKCRRLNEQGLDYPVSLYCHLLMMPVTLNMASLLDFIGWVLTR